MPQAPISVCLISRDDPHLDACLASIAPWVAEVVVVGVGRDTATRDIAAKHGALFASCPAGCYDSDDLVLDFSALRNASYALATQPWVLWLDSDDVVAGADKLEALCRAPPGTCYLLPYEYAYDARGRVITRQYRERLLHGRARMTWMYPVHEVLVATAPGAVRFVSTDDVVIKHQRQYLQKPTEPGRNLRILRKWMQTHPDDVRNTYYYGLELGNAGDTDGAIRELGRYLEKSAWTDERAMAYYQLARIHEGLREYAAARKAAFGSLETCDWYESYYAICRSFYFEQKWERCVHYGDIALSRPPTQTPLFLSEADRHDIHTLLCVAKNQLGDVAGALRHCEAGLAANGDEPSLLHNRPLLVKALGKDVPRAQPVNPARLNIVFATWLGTERWDPETMRERGLGGSETMLVHMARELAALGHSVTVYADPPKEATHDGVLYRSVHAFRNIACDVLVVSRYAQLLDEEYKVQAAVRLLWLHDVVAHGATPARLLRADRILALSRWHKDNIVAAHQVDPAKVVVTRNGIDLGRFRATLKRYKRVVNSSSPDRSWPVLLDVWPQIRAAVPEAELHLYYGFNTWRAMAIAADDKLQLATIERLEQVARETPGVVRAGRVNQEILAQAFLRASVWAHPTWFTETSCITAMEAKAAGLHIVTSNLAALKETAAGGVLIDGEWTSAEYRARFVNACVDALKSGPHGPWPDVDGFGLPELVQDWQRLFLELLTPPAGELQPYEPTAPYRTSPPSAAGGSPFPAQQVRPPAPARVGDEAGTLPRRRAVKLNIACGPNVFPFHGWINYDIEDCASYLRYLASRDTPLEGMPPPQQRLARYVREYPPTDWRIIVHDMTTPFAEHPDGSVDLIYVGQAIEHLNRRTQAPAFLRECSRMLRRGGVLRMTTPDLNCLLDHYPATLATFAGDQPEWFRAALPADQLAYLMFGAAGPNCTRTNYEGHFHLYTQDTLKALLEECGFTELDFAPGANPEITDEGLSHSLCVEATR